MDGTEPQLSCSSNVCDTSYVTLFQNSAMAGRIT